MAIEIQSVKVGRWYEAVAGQYRRVLNLDTGHMVTFELFDPRRGASDTLRVSLEAFAKAVSRETHAPLIPAE